MLHVALESMLRSVMAVPYGLPGEGICRCRRSHTPGGCRSFHPSLWCTPNRTPYCIRRHKVIAPRGNPVASTFQEPQTQSFVKNCKARILPSKHHIYYTLVQLKIQVLFSKNQHLFHGIIFILPFLQKAFYFIHQINF